MKKIKDWWMMWEIDPKGSRNPFEYFTDKYGEPGYFASGQPYKGLVPDGVIDLSKEISVPKNHIWIKVKR